MTRRTVLLPALVLAALLVACAAAMLALPEEAKAGFPGENGRIAFSSDRDGDFDVYTVRPSGLGLRQLTDSPGHDLDPEWSPDGSKIAFSSDRDGDAEIYVEDLVSGEVLQLTDNGSLPEPDQTDSIHDRDPTWSPDGSKIAFISNRDASPTEDAEMVQGIYVMKAKGSKPSGPLVKAWPDIWESVAWSPDGSTIIHGFGSEGLYDIWAVNADGSGERPLTDPTRPTSERDPDWSPSGEKIVYARAKRGYGDFHQQVWTMAPDGTNRQALTDTPAEEIVGPSYRSLSPVWSPNGRKIAFVRNGDVFKLRSRDGANMTQVTSTSYEERDPDWGPKPATSR